MKKEEVPVSEERDMCPACKAGYHDQCVRLAKGLIALHTRVPCSCKAPEHNVPEIEVDLETTSPEEFEELVEEMSRE